MGSDRIFIMGGGLSGALTAIRIAQLHPAAHIEIIEKASVLCGEHTWSCHEADLRNTPWLTELVDQTWPNYSVRFPGMTRSFSTPYHSIRSPELRKKMARYSKITYRMNAEVVHASDQIIRLSDDTELQGDLIFDARGFSGPSDIGRGGYQKFIGWDIEFTEPHSFRSPCIMDASVDQSDGYRFLYYLPWSDRTCLVEDTYYQNGPEISEPEMTARILTELDRQGLRVKRWLRCEQGVLPIPGRMIPRSPQKAGTPLTIGVRGGFFHATTGYSLPFAGRVAHFIGQNLELGLPKLRSEINRFGSQLRAQNRFNGFLNRMLFQAAPTDQRYRLLERFYRLPAPLIERFYGGETTVGDRLKILWGRPPVPVHRAIREIFYAT
jgi:lycopene beta-cyclase